jgi:hypothetical protein
MDDPMSGSLLSDPFLDEGLLRSEQLHGQLVVGRLEHALQVVSNPARLRIGGSLVVLVIIHDVIGLKNGQ